MDIQQTATKNSADKNEPSDIHVRHFDGPTGKLVISSSNGAVFSVHFVQSGEEMLPESGDLTPEISACISQLGEYFRGERTIFDFPYLQSGTVFQQRVWEELAKLPFGKTISYNQLAAKLGDPKVIRAAASANGRNKLAIIIPCHRVIGSNGDLVGYAGGISNKRWLLQHEAKFVHGVQTLF